MMSHPSIIAPVALCEESTGTIPLENACSHVTRSSSPTADRCEDYGCSGGCIDTDYVVKRSDGAFLSLAEMRKQSVIDIALHVLHLRQLARLAGRL